jgi:predicted membrane protein
VPNNVVIFAGRQSILQGIRRSTPVKQGGEEMDNKHDRVVNPRILIGLAIILIGILAILANLGLGENINIWDYWPVILIVIGLSLLLQPSPYRNSFPGLVFLIIGLLFLLGNFDIIDFGFNLLWPIIIILVGIGILRHGLGATGRSALDSDHINIVAILGGGEHNYTSRTLQGGKIFAFMGGAKLNLRDSDISGESMVIDALAVMGGVEIIVPDSWQVTIHGVPLLGGMDNKTSISPGTAEMPSAGSPRKQLIVKGMAIMGGVEVKN